MTLRCKRKDEVRPSKRDPETTELTLTCYEYEQLAHGGPRFADLEIGSLFVLNGTGVCEIMDFAMTADGVQIARYIAADYLNIGNG